jgi:hypothetical protein
LLPQFDNGGLELCADEPVVVLAADFGKPQFRKPQFRFE